MRSSVCYLIRQAPPCSLTTYTTAMSFQDVEAGLSNIESPVRNTQSPEEAAFANLQSSLSMQVFKIDNNVRGILKLVDQLGTQRDSPALRKSLYVASYIRYFDST
jgi:hypothetical protein